MQQCERPNIVKEIRMLLWKAEEIKIHTGSLGTLLKFQRLLRPDCCLDFML